MSGKNRQRQNWRRRKGEGQKVGRTGNLRSEQTGVMNSPQVKLVRKQGGQNLNRRQTSAGSEQAS